MKKLFFLAIPLIWSLQNCSSQNIYSDPGVVQQVLATDEFTFMAQRAVPSGSDVNNIILSMPARTSTRILELSHGYTLSLRNGLLTADLPYFGRIYQPVIGRDEQGLKFTSKDYSIQKQEGKNGKITYVIKPNDLSRINLIYVDVFRNGRSYISINSTDRQPISYDGYLTDGTTVKK